MTKFTGATIILGAVDETDTLRETIEYVVSHCDKHDLAEFVISCSQRITPESQRVVDYVTSADYGVPVRTIKQQLRGIETIREVMAVAQGSHCILLSSDMASDLDYVFQMIEGVKKEPDVIFKASRWLKGCKFHGYNKARLVMNYLGQIFLRVLFCKNLTDMTTPLQIAPTALYNSIRWEYDGFPFLLEMVLKPIRLGYKVKEIPTNCYARTQGKSNNSFRQTAAYLPTAFKIRFMKKSKILK